MMRMPFSKKFPGKGDQPTAGENIQEGGKNVQSESQNEGEHKNEENIQQNTINTTEKVVNAEGEDKGLKKVT